MYSSKNKSKQELTVLLVLLILVAKLIILKDTVNLLKPVKTVF
jgi:hypothetical protein